MSFGDNESVGISLESTLPNESFLTDENLTIAPYFSTLPIPKDIHINSLDREIIPTPPSQSFKAPTTLNELIESDTRDFVNISKGKRRRTTAASLIKIAFPELIQQSNDNSASMNKDAKGKGKEREGEDHVLNLREGTIQDNIDYQKSSNNNVRYLTREEDRAEIDEGIIKKLSSLRQQERELMSTLYRTKIENQILLNSRSLIDQKLRKVQHQQFLSRSKSIKNNSNDSEDRSTDQEER